MKPLQALYDRIKDEVIRFGMQFSLFGGMLRIPSANSCWSVDPANSKSAKLDVDFVIDTFL